MATNTSTETPTDLDNLEPAQAAVNNLPGPEKSPVVVPKESSVDPALPNRNSPQYVNKIKDVVAKESSVDPALPNRNFPQYSNKIKDIGDGRWNAYTKGDGFFVQLGKNGKDRMRSEWGLSQFGDKKKPIELEVTPAIEAKIKKLDDHAKSTFDAMKRAWFKKDKRLEHVPLIKTKEDGTRVVRVKVVCDGKKPTEIYSFVDKNSPWVADSTEALNRGCQCLVQATINSMWFTEEEYGIALTARVILVQKGVDKPLGVESMDLDTDFLWD